jgi:hypothetical protein
LFLYRQQWFPTRGCLLDLYTPISVCKILGGKYQLNLWCTMKKIWVVAIFIIFVCINAQVKANSGDVSGGVAIGTSYAGVDAAPTNGLIVQGSVGIGTTAPLETFDVNGVLSANSIKFNQVALPIPPGGRLTLSSSSPVMTADVSDVGSIYYLPFTGQNVPIYDGTNWMEQDIGSSGLSLTLNSTNMPTTEVFDIYASLQSGSPKLCALYWGGNTSRSSSAGGASGAQDARIVQQNGIWVNNAAIATNNCYNNTTAYTFGAGQGTLLGTFYTDAAAKVSWTCNPAATAAGSNNILGIGNIYNQVPYSCTELNSTIAYTLVVTTSPGVWREQDNSPDTRITYVDPLGYLNIYASSANVDDNVTVVGNYCLVGMCLNSASCTPKTEAGHNSWSSPVAEGAYATDIATGTFYSGLGLNYVQAMETNGSGSSTCTFNPALGEDPLIVSGRY